jgi:hypothetical protein
MYYLRPSKAVLSFTTLGPLGVETVLMPVPPGIGFLGAGLGAGFDTALPLTRSEKEGPLFFFFADGEEALGADLVIFTGGLATGLGGAFGTAVPTLLPEDGAVMFFLGPAEVEGDLTIALGAVVLGLGGAGVVCLAFL